MLNRLSAKVKEIPLWRDLRGKNGYRVFGALILEDLCAESEMKTAELIRRLRAELGRPLSRQTLAAWRRGDQAIPVDVMLATAVIVRRTLADASLAVAMRTLRDRAADPTFAGWMQQYYGRGRPEIPS